MKPIVTEAAEMMLQAMKDLGVKKIDAKDAQAIAQLGIGVVQAANAEVNFIKATRAMPTDGTFGTNVRFLEPGK
jgi:uncharacterized protein YaaN involved in tellurite resistance